MAQITSLNLLDVERFESPEILKKLALSSRRLAELKGIAGSIPNRGCKKFCVNRHFAGNCNFQKWNKNDYTIIIT